jgi:gamma-glutamyltranspeptidase
LIIGGNQIITSVIHVTLLNIFFNLNIKQSTGYPRIHHHFSPNYIFSAVAEFREF